ncbi:NADPH-dependent FMN reductase [Salinibacterium sp. ZJ450]|uniref:NADPH-dependent FMN reductase n=1 Tax=Salinibacterium sp. ZJ450 TaxID=2708338 RepID=UPI001CD48260|nr:NAD(P)H-dependent oxidoreductase [Salinibacterium sp. ZJ450]
MTKPLLQIIIGSTRPGRAGGAVAEWFAERARDDDRFEIEVLDLAEVGLPLMDEPHHPRLRAYQHEHTKAWSATIERGDAYVFVIPEYNYALNAATKNAIDYLSTEWARKALGIVSYGGISGGLRAAQMLKQVGSALKMATLPDTVIIPMIGALRDEDGRFVPTPIIEDSATILLDQLDEMTAALQPLRDGLLAAKS